MFIDIKKQMQEKFGEMSKLGTLYYVEVDRDKIWDVYLNAIPEEYRQSNNCNCCKSFLRQYGGIVGIKDNLMITLWDFISEDEEYGNAIKALRAYISKRKIKGVYYNNVKCCGTDRSPDSKRNVVWDHFHFNLPRAFVKNDVGPAQSIALSTKDVFERGLKEISDDAVDTVLELIGQGSLYRGNEFKAIVTEFRKAKTRYKKVKGVTPKDNFCWAESGNISPAAARIKNSSIGTLLVDLSEGRELDSAVSAFERVVAPANYKRPTALATPKMIDNAKKRLEELGMTGSLYRRMLSDKDLTVNNALFVHRDSNKDGDIFDQLKEDTVVNPKSLSKIEEVSIKDFVDNVLPTTKSLRVLVENKHLGNFVSLVGPKDPDDPTMFKWGNNYSWSYSGEVADSIKARVKAAGGKVDGILRVSLSWSNYDDLDLHLIEPDGNRVYYGNRGISLCGARLDVDMNAGGPRSREPVENIYWKNLPTEEGTYKVIVNQFSKRESSDQGFEVELDFQGETQIFSVDKNGSSGYSHSILTFEYTRKNGVVITKGKGNKGSYKSNEKWGINTGKFHKVKSVTLSPNYWEDKGVGNKHFMFFLDGCVSDEKTRGFYNEFLKEDLMKERKVFELLGNKVSVDSTKNELSGLGFSDTVKNDIIVEVEGAFKRMLKIKF